MKKHLPEGTALMAVVKANGYGHGDYETAVCALEAGADYLAVAMLDEALALRKKGITAPILVLGAAKTASAGAAAEAGVTLTAPSADWLKEAEACVPEGQRLQIHIKCDTGMGRIGIRERAELLEAEQLCLQSAAISLEGIFTHFATADEIDTAYYEKQLARFQSMLSWLTERPAIVHAANSAALLRFPEAVFNMVRAGIALYGLAPSQEMKELLPFELKEALSLKSRLVHVKKLHAGESVSYGAVFTAEEDCWIGTLPIGYADGWIRKLQGRDILINGQRLQLVGRICMDQCMVRLPGPLETGTPAVLIGQDGKERITVDDIAGTLDTINYEVTCMMAARLPRVYIKGGRVSAVSNALL